MMNRGSRGAALGGGLRALRRRSSPLSALVTAMIGWSGAVTLLALALGVRGSPFALFGVASVTALVQGAVLWPVYFVRLRLDGRPVVRGAVGGALSGALAFAPWVAWLSSGSAALAAWIAAALVAGAAVGGFLAYFLADDARLVSEGLPVDAGRDAHWLEPFVFGAGIFVAVCLPRSFDAAVYAAVVGASAGVVAAGLSHYTPDAWKASLRGFVAYGVIGGALGAAAALLLRDQPASLVAAPTAGALTLLVTVMRGQVLAAREAAARIAPPAEATAR